MAIPKIHVHDIRTEARRFQLTVNRNAQPNNQVEVSWKIKGTDLYAGLLFYVDNSEAVDPVPFVQKDRSPLNNTNAEAVPKSLDALKTRLVKLLKEAGHDSKEDDSHMNPDTFPVNQLFHHVAQESVKAELQARTGKQVTSSTPAHLMSDAELNKEADAVARRIAGCAGMPKADASTVIELSNRLIRKS